MWSGRPVRAFFSLIDEATNGKGTTSALSLP